MLFNGCYLKFKTKNIDNKNYYHIQVKISNK